MGLLADGIRMPLAGPKERMRLPDRARKMQCTGRTNYKRLFRKSGVYTCIQLDKMAR